MASRGVTAGVVLLAALAAAPVFGDQGSRRRPDGDHRGGRGDGRGSQRSVQRSPDHGRSRPERYRQAERHSQPQRFSQGARPQAYRRDVRPQVYRQDNRGYAQRRAPERYVERRHVDRYVDRRYVDRRHYSNRSVYAPRYGYPSRYGYGSRYGYSPRLIRPRIVTYLPYRPYHYRPSWSIGVYYGAGGSYPYGYTPRGYYDPLPGRDYGGIRITDAPREARVFADGYYVGIVDDFDGVFQHVNLEAGSHRIEVQIDGLEPVAFDVMVQPGRTITLRADTY